MTLDQAKSELTRGIIVRIPYGEDETHLRKLNGLVTLLKRSRGSCPVYLSVRDSVGRSAGIKLGSDYWVNPGALPIEEMEMLLGNGAIVFNGR
jgi:DNA polymerase III subunit alpha